MPTKREREYYAAGYRDGRRAADLGRSQFYELGERDDPPIVPLSSIPRSFGSPYQRLQAPGTKPKRKLSAWNKFVKANSKKPRFIMRSGKLNLKKMGVAFRKKKR